MSDKAGRTRVAVPSRVKSVVVTLVVQVGFTVLIGVLALASAESEADLEPGSSGAAETVTRYVTYASFAISAILVLCLVLLPWRRARPRLLQVLLTTEALAVLVGIVSLFSGWFLPLLAIGIAMGVMMSLGHEDARAWFTR